MKPEFENIPLVKAEKRFEIEESGKKLLPFCPYVFAFIRKHPEWKRIVDERFEGYDKL
ncbi:GNAT family N-acetyltransferase [Chryseobacterium sp. CBSDS_008]|uniref:GNAT family N-acetyltransferase n=1 Tax=Chryseobacterium sp. CBSDS_008 TaxID=3415265 RepID=UPI003CF73FD4